MKPHKNNYCSGYRDEWIDVKICNQCNAKCSWCIESDGWCPEQTSVEEMIKATIESPVKNVLVLGGEPLMYPHLKEYLEGIRPYKDKIYLTTNGVLLDDANVDYLDANLDGINLSLHHYDDTKNSAILGIKASNYTRLREVVPKFKTPVRVNCNLQKGYIDSSEEAEKMEHFVCNELQANQLRFVELKTADDDVFVGIEEVYSLFKEYDSYKSGCDIVFSKIHDFEVRLKFTCGLTDKRKPQITNPEFDKTFSVSVLYPNGYMCGLGWVTNTEIAEWQRKYKEGGLLC